MRHKLVTARTVREIIPIEGANNIELVAIDGWKCRVPKGYFKVGDIGIYFEHGSFLPNTAPFNEILTNLKEYKDEEGFILKTMKVRDVVSQGLLLQPLGLHQLEGDVDFDNLDSAFGVVKYEEEGESLDNSYPDFLPNTSEPDLQNLMHLFVEHKETYFQETFKLTGKPMVVYNRVNPDKLGFWGRLLVKCKLKQPLPTVIKGVCSETSDIAKDAGNYWRAVKKFNVFSELPAGYAVKGELLAPDISGNHEKVDSVQFYVTSVFDINKQRSLPTEYAEAFVREELPSCRFVPIVSRKVQIFKECRTMKDFLDRVEGRSINPGTISEGRVYQSVVGSTSFKVVSNSYLLKKK